MPGSNYVVNGDVVFPTGTQKAHIVISDGLISDLVFGDYPVGIQRGIRARCEWDVCMSWLH